MSTKVEKLENQLEGVQTRQREGKGLLSEITGAAGGGGLLGFLESRNPSLESGFGPGDRIKGIHVVAIGGLMLGRKKNKIGKMARGAGLGALFSITREMAKGFGA